LICAEQKQGYGRCMCPHESAETLPPSECGKVLL
jgi:hypothetical protein